MHPISDWLSVVRVVMWLPSQSGFNYQSSCHTPNTLPAFSASGDTGHQKHARACVCVCVDSFYIRCHRLQNQLQLDTSRSVTVASWGLILSVVLLERSTVFFVTQT